jgi:uncharacterized protein involved in exopolysaccharide biosynthesis
VIDGAALVLISAVGGFACGAAAALVRNFINDRRERRKRR